MIFFPLNYLNPISISTMNLTDFTSKITKDSLEDREIFKYILDKRILDNTFFLDFIKWKLDIPSIGILLGMGIFGSVSGIKICLG